MYTLCGAVNEFFNLLINGFLTYYAGTSNIRIPVDLLGNIYDPECRSLFEMGKLVIDGREMTFTIKVQNREAHKEIARDSFIYLMYLEITGRRDKAPLPNLGQGPLPGSRQSLSPKQGSSFEIVAAVTAGSVGRLRIGKRGVFFTTDGKEWDAQVVDIVKNPISLWESVKEPFQQFTGFIKKQVDKFTQSRKNKVEEKN